VILRHDQVYEIIDANFVFDSPVGMVFGEYGKMFFTSDVTGEIFVVTRVRSPYVDPYGLA